jgi:hypothetical protein
MLQELTNKIKKIIPEIEELKFGCKVDVFHKNILPELPVNRRNLIILGENRPNNTCLLLSHFGTPVLSYDILLNKKLVKIIGRDITLEDVLRCLEEKFKDNDYCKKRKSVYNAFSCFEVIRMWQLGKPLHEQSKETIKELNKLIC